MTETTASGEIFSLLLPLAGQRLLLPRAQVAEVTRHRRSQAVGDALPWIVGKLDWQGQSIPLISFEGACGQSVPRIGDRTRVVILHATCGHYEGSYYALLTQGFPQLVMVNAAVLNVVPDASWPPDSPVLCEVQMLNVPAVIPDLERIEIMLAESGGLLT